MSEKRYRVLAICAHPVQYMAPNLRRLAKEPSIDFQVAYCSLKGALPSHDSEFNTTVQWDIPLLDGYDWAEVPNKGSGSESFFGLNNPGLWRLIRKEKFDAILCYTGYVRASFWIAYAASRLGGTAFLFGTDASALASRIAKRWKTNFKQVFWPVLFSLADQVIVPSTATANLIRSLGVPDQKITLTPYSVDNDWWLQRSREVDRKTVRAEWGASPTTCVFLFCAKLQFWKRPFDLLHAFASVSSRDALLIFAGEGPLRSGLADEALRLGISERVRFLGFVNQSVLPAIYTASDLMVLPSEYEPFAVVVNEASCCGCPVAASDHVGAAGDLIAPVSSALIFPCGDVQAIAKVLENAIADRFQLTAFGQAARKRMDSWSPRENIRATIAALERAIGKRHRRF
jgi:glycosyltransferase involved in cell wall biosynthesis